ncbi:MAG: methionyl-tRNA formyltransferase [delta proteobacterium MLS_D]|nr:MAG: methionyl-tRNA formyltransferase [delta proteobacterium MLS_D]
MKPTILFMGTPEFAVPSLERLIENDYPVIGVVTQPDRPKGRGRKQLPTPVKVRALEAGIPVYEPARVRGESFLEQFRELAPDMVVLAAFGQILPKEIIDTPPLGCLNVHPSLLPRYRGAAPINWALIRGETKTGVSIMLMDEGVDSGDVLLQKEVPIEPEDTCGDLTDRLSLLGADLLLDAVKVVADGTAVPIPQDASAATFAPRLTPETGHIDWSRPAEEVANLIRGLSPVPGAYSFLRDRKLKIFFAVAGKEEASGEKAPGSIGKLVESGLQVMAGDGHVYLQDVQMEGRKRLPIDLFLRGFSLTDDDALE